MYIRGPIKAIYNHIILIIQLLLRGGQYPRFRVLGLGWFRVCGSGCRVQVLGLRVGLGYVRFGA